MLFAVTEKKEIEKCQKTLVKNFKSEFPNIKQSIVGYSGGSFETDLICNKKGNWFSSQYFEGSAIPRYWNAFGTKILEGKSQNIVVEINPPLEGYSRLVSGLFAKDEASGEYFILHRGKIGGGRKGIGKEAFSNWYRGEWVDVLLPDGAIDELILVARLNSENFSKQVMSFVIEVEEFKKEVTSGHLSRQAPKSFSDVFSPEFHGKKKGKRSSRFEYESFHGLVVNQLEIHVREEIGTGKFNIFNTRNIDLAVSQGNSLKSVYEVKSSANSQSIYTAIGQLFCHSYGHPGAKMVLVIPDGELNDESRRIVIGLGISIKTYIITGGIVKFTST